jgi:flagellar biosynthesis chaperone FliJ
MSGKQDQKSSGILQWVWPSISDEESARGAIVYGFGWYIFSVAITAVIGFSSLAVGHEIAGYNGWSLVDAALLALIAWRLWKNSRAWAVTGLAYESINVLYKLSEHQVKFGIMPILIYFAAINSVRGAFAFHKYNVQERDGKPITPESSAGAAATDTQNVRTSQNSSDLKGIAMFVPDKLKANAFRVLRLPSKASLSDVHRAAGDMRRAAMLGTITTNSGDVPVLGELPNSETDIRAAVGRIENPELRLIDRMFWFHSDKASLVEKKTFMQHDSILHELFNALSETVDEACVQKWTKTLEAWYQFVSDDTYWEQIGELELEGGFEPAAYPSEIEGLRSRAVELAAEPLIVAGREAIGRNDARTIYLILTALGGLESTGSWAQSAQLEIASPLVERFKALCKGLRVEFEQKILRKDDVAQQNQAPCAAELARFRADVQPELTRLTQLLPPGSEALQEAREEAALLLSGIASDFTWADEFVESEKLYEEALKLAENTFGSIRVQTALEGIRSSAHHQRVTGKSISSAPALISWWGNGFTIYGHYDDDPATNSYTSNYYLTVFFLPVLPLKRYRVIQTGHNRYQFLGKLPLRKGDRWHLGIGLTAIAIALIIAMVSTSDSRGSYSSGTTPVSGYSSSASSSASDSPSLSSTPDTSSTSSGSFATNSSSNNSAELDELKQKIEAGRSQIESIEGRLRPVMAEVDSFDDQMKPLKSEIDSLKEQKSAGTEVDTDHYNSLVDQYNSLLRRKKSLIEENRADLDRYEDLQREDKSLMQQWKALGGKVE